MVEDIGHLSWRNKKQLKTESDTAQMAASTNQEIQVIISADLIQPASYSRFYFGMKHGDSLGRSHGTKKQSNWCKSYFINQTKETYREKTHLKTEGTFYRCSPKAQLKTRK